MHSIRCLHSGADNSFAYRGDVVLLSMPSQHMLSVGDTCIWSRQIQFLPMMKRVVNLHTEYAP